MRRLLFIGLALSMSIVATAQSIDKIQSKDGSIYYGFISEQIPGKQVMVYAENASLVFNKKEMQNQRKDYYDFNLLSEDSKSRIRHITDTASLNLLSFEYKGRYFENMYITERLDSTIIALALTPRSYIIPWKDVSKTSRLTQNDDPYGIRDIVTLKNGERITGQVIEQEISKTLTIKDEKGIPHKLNTKDILSILSEKISEKHTIWEQAPLLDRVIFNNGSEVEGFITSRVMGQNLNIITKNSSITQAHSAKDVKKYQKTRNRDYVAYAPDTAKVVLLNDKGVVLQGLKAEDGLYAFKDTLSTTVLVGSVLKIKIKNIPHQKTAALYEYTKLDSATNPIRSILKKDEIKFAIFTDTTPIYETVFTEEDNYLIAEVTVRKSGQYFLAIDGFDSGLNIKVEAKLEDKE